MKKIIIRIIGALCIFGALAILFCSPWVRLKNVSNRELRNIRQELTGDIALVRDKVTEQLADPKFRDELRDHGLPGTKAGVKKGAREVSALIEELLNDRVSFGELVQVSAKAPGYIRDVENLLDTRNCGEAVFEASEYVYYDDAEELIDTVSDYVFLLYIVTGFFVLVGLFGCAGAITHCFGKVKWLKYSFLGILAVLVVGVAIAVHFASGLIPDMFELPKEFQKLSLQITPFPLFALVLGVMPVVLEAVFDREKPVREVTQWKI